MQNAISWFEIPVTDIDRAQAFYETVLGRKLRREDFGGQTLAVFPYDKPGIGGALQAGANASARAGSGIRIYLDCMPSIDAVLARIEKAGGQIVAPKSALPPGMGFIAHLRDTEGNEVGLHALD
ncbi:VOC family protein [Variovorax sp. V59]|jgi:predicted enzyme related to lactoylglutathione lyase|uniref:Enzyme related to lactoylglutathione lyase n=1 Tax=Variovorax paradoxus TaxID=34073 RepID=A0AAE4BYF8_VARPD|nr:VOC family protein [Variovorax paradoxus]MDP9962792.1 putative enzyme related to lactoylglutathione lyase [Variovorax paradoxus]MDR6427848.1 putative enzyme related to lactoylglutathione lyase [Variovorax paradoxus]